MRKYYAFVIKKEVASLYEFNLKELYVSLYQLYNYKNSNINHPISLYKQMCNKYNTKNFIKILLTIPNIKNNNNKFLYLTKKEASLLFVNYSTLVIITNSNFPYFFWILNLYSNYVFICDFENNDYFWLSKQIITLR